MRGREGSIRVKLGGFKWYRQFVEGKMGAMVSYLKGTPGPSGFGSAATAEDVTAGLDLHNYTAIVTGA